MRSHTFNAVFLAGQGLLVGCALMTAGGCVEQRAVTATAYGIELPAGHPTGKAGSVAARDFLGEVRLGHALDRLGKVPPSLGARKFALGNPIHLSMWEVTEARAGSVVSVSVRDAQGRIVWSEDQQAPHGGSYLSFGIGRNLARGTYRADVTVGHEVRSRMSFEVFDRKNPETRSQPPFWLVGVNTP